MSFKFECPNCGQRIEAIGEAAGSIGQCPTCKQSFRVPNPPDGTDELSFASQVMAREAATPRSAVPTLLRFLYKSLSLTAVIIGIGIALWQFAKAAAIFSDRRGDAERALSLRITFAAAADKDGRVPFALAAGTLGNGSRQLHDADSQSPASAAARFGRFHQSVHSIHADRFPSDVLPVWTKFVGAVDKLDARLRTISPSEGLRLLDAILAGGAQQGAVDSEAGTDAQSELMEYRATFAAILEAQERYRVQEILDYIYRGK